MKNRKFIKTIIFSLLLLLCFCVPFLVHNNNVKAQTEITDLTGMTVSVPSGWNASWMYGKFTLLGSIERTYDNNTETFVFSSNNTYNIGIGEESDDDVAFYVYNSSTDADNWVYIGPLSSFVLRIIGGTDATNQDLIEWFIDNNATFSGGSTPEDPDPVYTISGQYQFNEEITWLYDISEQEGILYLPFYVYNLDNSNRVNYDYMLNKYNEVDQGNDFLYANETASGTFFGQVAGYFTTSTTVRMRAAERIIYFYTAEVSEGVYNWLLANGQFINDTTLDPNNPENPDSDNNPNNPNNPDFGTDTVRQIVNQVNTFLGIQILPGLSFRDILLICIALPLLMYILKVFLGG